MTAIPSIDDPPPEPAPAGGPTASGGEALAGPDAHGTQESIDGDLDVGGGGGRSTGSVVLDGAAVLDEYGDHGVADGDVHGLLAAEEELQSWQLDRSRAPIATKIVVAGGFGVGKTTFVGSVSEITPLQTEALMTQASVDVDDLAATPQKTTTTVAMDFGRLTLASDLVLYLFGTPGQQRFWFMWDDLVRGAIGAVVLVDTRRLEDCWPALDYFESTGLPYVVAVNHFEGTTAYGAEDVRDALTVPPHVPIVIMDARRRSTVVVALRTLVSYALDVTPE